jgi:CBS domain-containing protein
MIAADVMTPKVIAIRPDAALADAVALMLDRRISGLFVVDERGALAGVLTEGDLLHRGELGTERHRSWWQTLFASPGRLAAEFTRTHGRRVRDVMTKDVISVRPDAKLSEVVGLMEAYRVKRVPVIDQDRLVGVVSRSDLLRAIAMATRGAGETTADDRALREAILQAMTRQPWAPVTTLNVTVAAGVADVWGSISSQEERRAICVIAENTPGVKRVIDHLVYVETYTGTVIEPAPGQAL